MSDDDWTGKCGFYSCGEPCVLIVHALTGDADSMDESNTKLCREHYPMVVRDMVRELVADRSVRAMSLVLP